MIEISFMMNGVIYIPSNKRKAYNMSPRRDGLVVESYSKNMLFLSRLVEKRKERRRRRNRRWRV